MHEAARLSARGADPNDETPLLILMTLCQATQDQAGSDHIHRTPTAAGANPRGLRAARVSSFLHAGPLTQISPNFQPGAASDRPRPLQLVPEPQTRSSSAADAAIPAHRDAPKPCSHPGSRIGASGWTRARLQQGVLHQRRRFGSYRRLRSPKLLCRLGMGGAETPPAPPPPPKTRSA